MKSSSATCALPLPLDLEEKCSQLMMLKFGRVVDFEAVQARSVNIRLEELKLQIIEKEYEHSQEINEYTVRCTNGRRVYVCSIKSSFAWGWIATLKFCQHIHFCLIFFHLSPTGVTKMSNFHDFPSWLLPLHCCCFTSYFLMQAVDGVFIFKLASSAFFCFSPYERFSQSAILQVSAGSQYLLPASIIFLDELFEYSAPLADAWDTRLCSMKSACLPGIPKAQLL